MSVRIPEDPPGHAGAGARPLRAPRSSAAILRRFYQSDIIGIAIGDCYGRLDDTNDAFLAMLGYSRAELQAGELRWDTITPPEYRETDERAREQLRSHGVAEVWEKEFVHKDGRRVPVLIGVALLAGSDSGTVCYTIDNTRRKQAEDELKRLNEELEDRVRQRTAGLQASEARADAAARALVRSEQQLRALAGRLHSVREAERSQVAREIHDVLGQELTSLKMDAAFLLRRIEHPDPLEREPLAARLQDMIAQLDATLLTVRRIATELRPGVLDDLGLIAALLWQAKEFQARAGVVVELCCNTDEVPIDSAGATAVFRIFQELLTNIARHACARRVRVTVIASDGELTLEVSDDGRGISEHDVSNSRSLGLIGIRERALMFGGDFTITGEPGVGTRARLTLPLAPGGAPR
jgi:PAS domain S-box-containing protein